MLRIHFQQRPSSPDFQDTNTHQTVFASSICSRVHCGPVLMLKSLLPSGASFLILLSADILTVTISGFIKSVVIYGVKKTTF